LWSRVAYPSLKPLGAWITDLTRRLKMFLDWFKSGPPAVFTLSYFINIQSFLTAILQNYARLYKTVIDDLSFDVEVVPDITPEHKLPPQDGCYITGLYLEGARWDADKKSLGEPFERQLFSAMPVIYLKPAETSRIQVNRIVYRCPVYKTSRRSAINNEPNFILSLNLRSLQAEKVWVKRGVALVCQLDQ